MKKLLLAAASLFVVSAAWAADNAIVLTPGSGVTERSVDVGAGVQSPMVQIGNSAGTNLVGAGATVPISGTIQPGNTANTTAWLVTGTGGTFPTTAAAAAYVNGWDATQGTTTDAACSTDNGTCTLIALLKRNNQNVSSGSGAFGSAFPANGIAIGGSDGTNMHSFYLGNFGTTPSGQYAVATNTFVTNTNPNGQTTASSSSPVVLASDQFGDPCYGKAKSTASFSSATSGGQIVAGLASNKTYVCSMTILASAAANVSLIEGTGSSVCTGSPVAVWGNTGTTAANGFPFAANGGVTIGTSIGTIAKTAVNANNLCLLFTVTNTPLVVATVAYVQAP